MSGHVVLTNQGVDIVGKDAQLDLPLLQHHLAEAGQAATTERLPATSQARDSEHSRIIVAAVVMPMHPVAAPLQSPLSGRDISRYHTAMERPSARSAACAAPCPRPPRLRRRRRRRARTASHRALALGHGRQVPQAPGATAQAAVAERGACGRMGAALAALGPARTSRK